jgi:hypothetical protein
LKSLIHAFHAAWRDSRLSIVGARARSDEAATVGRTNLARTTVFRTKIRTHFQFVCLKMRIKSVYFQAV